MDNDRGYERGLPDRQADFPCQIDECGYIGCQQPIYADEKNWELYGLWFCSAVCIARHVDARKKYPERST